MTWFRNKIKHELDLYTAICVCNYCILSWPHTLFSSLIINFYFLKISNGTWQNFTEKRLLCRFKIIVTDLELITRNHLWRLNFWSRMSVFKIVVITFFNFYFPFTIFIINICIFIYFRRLRFPTLRNLGFNFKIFSMSAFNFQTLLIWNALNFKILSNLRTFNFKILSNLSASICKRF